MRERGTKDPVRTEDRQKVSLFNTQPWPMGWMELEDLAYRLGGRASAFIASSHKAVNIQMQT